MRQWKLCTWPVEALEIKCVELIILNLNLNKKNEMFNNKLFNALCRSLQLFIFNIMPNLVLLHVHLIIVQLNLGGLSGIILSA